MSVNFFLLVATLFSLH